jgi:hypothetical protein
MLKIQRRQTAASKKLRTVIVLDQEILSNKEILCG